TPDEWRAITLWQPWASLIAEGVKWIETRPRRCNWQGWTMIHAAQRVPDHLSWVGEWSVHSDLRLMEDGACREMRRTGAVDHHGQLVADRYERGLAHPLPLGAVVAVARLTDCLPMVDTWPHHYDAHDSRCIYAGTKWPLTIVGKRESMEGEPGRDI